MARPSFKCAVFVSALIMAVFSISAGASEVVYDNTSTPTSAAPFAPDGFWSFNAYWPNELMGDEITLAGTSREIVQFDLILSSTQEITLADLTLRFHRGHDSATATPGAEIWTGTISDVLVNGPTTVSFDVPSVAVPDTFIWLAAADSDVAGMATYDSPTLGSSDDYLWDYDEPGGGVWYLMNFGGNPAANFGAKITAVPEPATIVLLTVGAVAVWRRRR